MPELVLGVEVCEDLWVPTSPSCRLAENGATLIANLSASSEAVGKPQYRRMLVQMQSAKLVCAYLFADAGLGESTTDITFSGHNIISENGVVLSESKRYTCGVSYADVDLQKITAERRRITTFPVKQEMSFVQKTFTLPLQNAASSTQISQKPICSGQPGGRKRALYGNFKYAVGGPCDKAEAHRDQKRRAWAFRGLGFHAGADCCRACV